MSQSSTDRPATGRSVLRQLLFSMLAFGAGVGVAFPPFARTALGAESAMSAHFFIMCVFAGLMVGAANFAIFKLVVSRELVRVVSGMRHINEAVAVARDTGGACREDCKMDVTSDDLIGDVAVAFNSMTEAVGRRITVEATTRALLADLSSCVELSDVSSHLLNAFSRICQAQAAALYAYTGTRMQFLARLGVDDSGEIPASIDSSMGMAEQALASGRVVHAVPSKDGFEWVRLSSPLGSMMPRSITLIPLMAEHKAIGLVVLACAEEDLPEESRLLMNAMRVQVAPYLSNAVLHDKLQSLAAIDELTHVLNRRFGVRRLTEEFSRATRHGVPLSVMMIDIDHFKAFNDSFGHDAGDAVLTSVASILEKSVRAGDIVCRYGGEELIVVAPGMGLADAAVTAERLRRIVETTPTQWRDQSLHVTVSIGAASWPVAKVSTPDELISMADQAMYHAKNSGRDQVSLHQGDKIIPLSMLVTDAAQVRVRPDGGENE